MIQYSDSQVMGRPVELEFHGAAQEVTGSMHILHLPAGPVALDCGLFQGKRRESHEKNMSFPLPPQEFRAVLLSHAHMDHSGNLPGMVRQGFNSPIFASEATCDLCRVMLADSAHIQEEDARFWNEKRARTLEDYIEPLYTLDDADATNKYLTAVPYDKSVPVADGCRATFVEAGHILGSCCILVEIAQGAGGPIRLLYTGDLGRFNVPILRDPCEPLPRVDYLITESTYADRRHGDASDMKEKLVWIINQTRDAGGKIIIPSFSVGRTQTVVYLLSQAMEEGLLRPLPIYVDSPLSSHTTEVFKKHPELYDREARELWDRTGDVFGAGKVRYVASVQESKALNARKDPIVIIASSGMCEAGRVLHHLANNVEDEANTVAIIGFQAQHTLGRRIVERREEIKILGRMYKLLCRVEVLNGLSAHADHDDFVRLLGPLAKDLRGAFVVHGEAPRTTAMVELLGAAGCKEVHIPAPGQRFVLSGRPPC